MGGEQGDYGLGLGAGRRTALERGRCGEGLLWVGWTVMKPLAEPAVPLPGSVV